MKKFLFGITVFAALSGFALNANSKELIREFNGSESKYTVEFEVKAPWIVDWRVRGDYPGQMAVHVELVRAPSGEYLGKIVTTKYVSNGVRFFNESGRYRFQVNSTLASWTLRVEQLTREEAETYIPKEKLK
jgi:hypothetical protein